MLAMENPGSIACVSTYDSIPLKRIAKIMGERGHPYLIPCKVVKGDDKPSGKTIVVKPSSRANVESL